MNRQSIVWCGVMLGLAMSVPAGASEVAIPNTFVGGTPAKATEVNDNFTAVKNAVNDNAGDIATLQNNVTTLQSDVSNNEARITDLETQTQNLATQMPGMAVNYNASFVTLSTTAATAVSLTVNVLNTGYILINYKGLSSITHTNGTRDMIRIELFNAASNIANGPSFVSVQTPAVLPSSGDIYYYPMTTQRIFSVTPGQHIFYLRADLLGGTSGSLGYNYMTATFAPNLIGTLPANY